MTLVLYPAAASLGQGSSGGPQVGSGRSVPGGVESSWEFNGLLMNMRRWYDTYLVTDIDGIDDADVRDERMVNPQSHGETPFDSFYAGRTITLSGKIRAFSLDKLRDLEQGMRQAFADLQEHDLVIRSGRPATDVKISAKKYQKLTIKEVQSNLQHTRDFQVSLRAADPFFLSLIENYATIPTINYTNGIPNPSLETNSSFWTSGGTATESRVTTDGTQGTACFELTQAALAAGGTLKAFIQGAGSGLAVGTGDIVFLMMSGKVTAQAAQAQRLLLQARGLTASGATFVSDNNLLGTSAQVLNPVLGQWYTLSGWFVIPAGVTVVTPEVAMLAHAVTGGSYTIRADAAVAAKVASTSVSLPYFDGNTALARWLGTVNLSQSVYEPAAAATLTNDGNFEARPRFRIIGPITNPVITNTTNGDQLRLNVAIPVGQVWTIDCLKRTVVDNAGANRFDVVDVSSVWPTLESGDNVVQLGGTNTTNGQTSLQAFWNDTWL